MLYTELRKNTKTTFTDAGRLKKKKTGREGSHAVARVLFRWTDAQRTGWCPFRGATQFGRARRKRRDNEDLGGGSGPTSV